MVLAIKAKKISRNRDPQTQLFTQSDQQAAVVHDFKRLDAHVVPQWLPHIIFQFRPNFHRPLLNTNITWRHKSPRKPLYI